MVVVVVGWKGEYEVSVLRIGIEILPNNVTKIYFTWYNYAIVLFTKTQSTRLELRVRFDSREPSLSWTCQRSYSVELQRRLAEALYDNYAPDAVVNICSKVLGVKNHVNYINILR